MTVGNGSCEILLAAAEAMLEPGAEIVYAWPSFSMYPHLAAMTGARAVTVPLRRGGPPRPRGDGPRGHRRHAHRDRVQPEQPDAPRRCRRAAIDAFVADLPRHVAVILDEAYVEFSTLQDPDESLDLLERHPNLVLLRTFSKVYGLCGLRVGLRARLGGLPAGGGPGAPAVLGQRAGPGGGRGGAAATRTRSSGAWSARRSSACTWSRSSAERGLETTDSQANFSWVSLGDRDEAEVVRGLAERGVIVRAGTALGQEGWLRVTYGTPRRRTTAFCRRWTRFSARNPCEMSSHAPISSHIAASGGPRRAYLYWRFS